LYKNFEYLDFEAEPSPESLQQGVYVYAGGLDTLKLGKNTDL